MRWLELGWIVPVVIGLGCGNTVTDDTSSGGGGSGAATSTGGAGGSGAAGGGGSGGSTASTGTTSVTTTSSTSSSTTTSSTTFADVCEQACAKAGECGLPADTCGQVVSCGTPQGECAADCINDPDIDCADIFLAVQNQSGPLIDCVFGCQGGQGGAGGMGQGGMGQGGGSPAACQQCGQDSCTNAFFQCAQAPGGFQACQDWLGCAQGCADAACLDACTAMYPNAQVIEDCLCTQCTADCGPVCNGSSGSGGGMPACQDCGTLALQGGADPCVGSDTLFADVKDCICVTACAGPCGNDCANPNLNLQNVSPQCQQCAAGAIQQACAADWAACQNDPN